MIYSDNDDGTALTTTAITSKSTTKLPSSTTSEMNIMTTTQIQQVVTTTARNSEFCIEMESSDKSCSSGTWTGSPIDFFHNNIKKAVIESKFKHFSFCLPTNEVDIKNDKFKFHIKGGDDVSKINCELLN